MRVGDGGIAGRLEWEDGFLLFLLCMYLLYDAYAPFFSISTRVYKYIHTVIQVLLHTEDTYLFLSAKRLRKKRRTETSLNRIHITHQKERSLHATMPISHIPPTSSFVARSIDVPLLKESKIAKQCHVTKDPLEIKKNC